MPNETSNSRKQDQKVTESNLEPAITLLPSVAGRPGVLLLSIKLPPATKFSQIWLARSVTYGLLRYVLVDSSAMLSSSCQTFTFTLSPTFRFGANEKPTRPRAPLEK